jgi:hypothetical protein
MLIDTKKRKIKMKRLITICAVVGLMLSLTCVSWANLVKPTVNHPPGDDPTWWNTQCPYYAYGWWEADLTPGSGVASPPNDGTHWATNFLGSNTAFTASIPGPDSTGTTVSINLNNVYRKDYYKEIYIYLRGTTTAGPGETISGIPDTDGGTFSGEGTFGIGSGEWHYKLIGEIIPQPNWVNLMVTVPGLTSVTDIWAGENCIPEPATISLLGLGVLSLLRRKRSV